MPLSQARNELRKNLFFHKNYDPRVDEPIQKKINEKIYKLNSVETINKKIQTKTMNLLQMTLSWNKNFKQNRSKLMMILSKLQPIQEELLVKNHPQQFKIKVKVYSKTNSHPIQNILNDRNLNLSSSSSSTSQNSKKTKGLSQNVSPHHKILNLSQIQNIQDISAQVLKKYAPKNLQSNPSMRLKELENMLDMGYSKNEILKQLEMQKDGQDHSLYSKIDSEKKLLQPKYIQPKLKILLSKQYKDVFTLERLHLKRLSPIKFFQKYSEIIDKYINPDLTSDDQTSLIRNKLKDILKKQHRKVQRKESKIFNFQNESFDEGISFMKQNTLNSSSVGGSPVRRNFLEENKQFMSTFNRQPRKNRRYEQDAVSLDSSNLKFPLFIKNASSVSYDNTLNSTFNKLEQTSFTKENKSLIKLQNTSIDSIKIFKSSDQLQKIRMIKEQCESQVNLTNTKSMQHQFKHYDLIKEQLNQHSLLLQNSVTNLQNLQQLGEIDSKYEDVKQDVLLEQNSNERDFMEQDNLDKYFVDNKKNSLYIARYAKRRQLWKPDQLKLNRKVKIAENYNQLLSQQK
eukprot:403374496